MQLDPDAVAVTAHLDRTLEQRQRVALHDRMLDCLSEEQREVFVMAEIEQWSAPEIAATLSVKLNTVYLRLRLAPCPIRTRLPGTAQRWRPNKS